MYTIKPSKGASVDRIIRELNAAIDKSKFRATLTNAGQEIYVRPVRLREKKPYCGQHPGECQVGPRPGQRRQGTWLEWNDWVEFHALVNKVLDRLKVVADVWTTPAETIDQGKKMWVRRGSQARVRWDWTERPGLFRAVRVWNHGSPDQFEA